MKLQVIYQFGGTKTQTINVVDLPPDLRDLPTTDKRRLDAEAARLQDAIGLGWMGRVRTWIEVP